MIYKEAIKNLERAQKFEYLMDNLNDIIETRKSAIKFTDNIGFNIEQATNKGLFTSHKDDPKSGVIKRTIIGNTYNWMDSHDDVHVGSTFGKSIKERGASKIIHRHDHLALLTAKVGEFSNVYEKNVLWRDLNVNKDGFTTSLFGDSSIQQYRNPIIFQDYLENKIDQHSVGMFYVIMELAIDDNGDQYKKRKELFDKYIGLIGNKAEVLEQGYFWAVSEAKLIEISAVTEGSNKLTNTVQNIPPSNDTEKSEPTKVTQKKKSFYTYL